jgi:hypothetical protein
MDIINLNTINKLPKDILSNINNNNIKLNINFDNDCEKQINIFLSENKNNKNYYLNNNYVISIDLFDYNYNIYIWLIKSIEIAFLKISKTNKYIELFENPSHWNISVCKNIMFNFPFTLSNIIYLPISYIELCYSSNDTDGLVKTLIHEKIHLGQRNKEEEWEKFINNNSNKWIKIKSNTKIFNLIEHFINNNTNTNTNTQNYSFISNPDTFYPNFKYIYGDEEKYFYGHYILDKKTKQIEKKYFQIDINKKTFEPTSKDLNEEHPYEIWAYKISNDLI